MKTLGLFLICALTPFVANAEYATTKIPVEGTMHITPYIDSQTITADDFDQQFVAFGGTFAWSHFELDIAHGIKDIHCVSCKWETGNQSGSLIGARVYLTNRFESARPYLSYQHVSDAFRGPPLDRNEEEPTVDFPSVGVTLSYFERFDLDLSYGRGALDCGYLDSGKPCNWSSTYQVRFRTFPMRSFKFNTLKRNGRR